MKFIRILHGLSIWRAALPVAMISGLYVASLNAQPSPEQALKSFQSSVCSGQIQNVHLYFDYESISRHWFQGKEYSEAECSDRMSAFKKAVEGWSRMKQVSPLCSYQIASITGHRFKLKFRMMYSYLDGPWIVELRQGRAVVVQLPAPPEPPPYGCGLPE